MKGWLKIPAAAEYYGVSVRTFREWLKAGFPHVVSPSGTKLVNLPKGDEYLMQFDATQHAEKSEKIIDELIKGLT